MIAQLYAGDVLIVDTHAVDMDGRLWWYVTDCRTLLSGFVMDEMVGQVGEDVYEAFMQQLKADQTDADEDTNHSEIIDPEITEPEQTEDEPTPDFDEIIQNIVVPGYVFPYEDNTNLRSEPLTGADNVLMQVNVNDVLTISGYAVDAQGNVWWQATDYRTGTFGFIMADVTAQLDEQAFAHSARIIDAEKNASLENTGEDNVVIEEEDADRIAAEQAEAAARLEQERLEAEAAAKAEADRIAAEQAEQQESQESKEQISEEPESDELESDESESDEPESEPQAPAVRYAVTSNKNSNKISNLRAQADSKADIVGQYENGELLIWDNPTDDGKWYPVTVVRDGAQGYMRDYLLTEISEADAQLRMAEILAQKAEQNQEEDTQEEISDETDDEIIDETDGEIIDETDDEIIDETDDEIIDETDGEIIDETDDEIIDETDGEIIDETDDEIIGETDGEIIGETDDETIGETDEEDHTVSGTVADFPAYAMSLEQENNAAIVLREEPAGGMPQSGAIPMISAPTPLEILDEKFDSQGNSWYLVRNMNNGETGYLEASNVQAVSEMVEMISVSRQYESNQKMIQTIDSTLEIAANRLGKV